MDQELISLHTSLFLERTPYFIPRAPFDLGKDWDLDSTPWWFKRISRRLGVRTPELEAAIILASLGHDIRYYYGGTRDMKDEADRAFEREIIVYAGILGGPEWAERAAGVDRFAVGLFGIPSAAGFAWSYGMPPLKRGFTPPSPTQRRTIDQVVQTLYLRVVGGRYLITPRQAGMTTPAARQQLDRLLQTLRTQPQHGSHLRAV